MFDGPHPHRPPSYRIALVALAVGIGLYSFGLLTTDIASDTPQEVAIAGFLFACAVLGITVGVHLQ